MNGGISVPNAGVARTGILNLSQFFVIAASVQQHQYSLHLIAWSKQSKPHPMLHGGRNTLIQ
jgi:hypothetical protein